MITDKSNAKHKKGITYQPLRQVTYKQPVATTLGIKNTNEWQSIKNTEMWCFNRSSLCMHGERQKCNRDWIYTYSEMLRRVDRQITIDVSKIRNDGRCLPVDAAWYLGRANAMFRPLDLQERAPVLIGKEVFNLRTVLRMHLCDLSVY